MPMFDLFEKYPETKSLLAIGSGDYTNDRGRCVEANHVMKSFLVDGEDPVVVDSLKDREDRCITLGSEPSSKYNREVTSSTRDVFIEQMLKKPAGVYVFACEAHEYGLIRDADKLYISDTSQGVFKEVKEADDFTIRAEDHYRLDGNGQPVQLTDVEWKSTGRDRVQDLFIPDYLDEEEEEEADLVYCGEISPAVKGECEKPQVKMGEIYSDFRQAIKLNNANKLDDCKALIDNLKERLEKTHGESFDTLLKNNGTLSPLHELEKKNDQAIELTEAYKSADRPSLN